MKILAFGLTVALIIGAFGCLALTQEIARLRLEVTIRESETRILQEELRSVQAKVPLRTYEEGIAEATLRAAGPDGTEHARSYTEGYHAAITQFGGGTALVGGKWPEDAKEEKKDTK